MQSALRWVLGILLGVGSVALLSAAGCGSSSSGGTTNPAPDGSAASGAGGTSSSGSGGTGDSALGNTVPCASDKQCTPTSQLCDPNRNLCVDCLIDADCGMNAACSAGACKAFQPCVNSLTCTTDQVCGPDGRCVECATTADCAAASVCSLSACHPKCASDKDCTAANQLCNTSNGFCVECVKDADCGTTGHCNAGGCSADSCVALSALCLGTDLFTCGANGDGYALLTCPSGCSKTGGAHCASDGAGGSTGGSGSAGASGSLGASGSAGSSAGGGSAGSAGAGGACPGEMTTVPSCGTPAVTTVKSYSGIITLTFSGTMKGSSTNVSDAFYDLTSGTPTLSTGGLRYAFASEGTCLCASECPSTSHQLGALLVGGYPPYAESHVYTVRADLGSAPASQLNFAIADCGCFDNSGGYSLSINCP